MASASHDRRPMVAACACALAGLAVLLLALTAFPGSPAPAPPAILSSPTPVPAAGAPAATPAVPDLAGVRAAWKRAFVANENAHVPASWVAGFYPLYERAQRAFGVNWLLLASVHRQETAFSTADGTYQGRNFAGCCAGPMQFNVTDGRRTTWERFADAFQLAKRPATYPHPTATHPSVYDDFDSIMAAARLLSSDGASKELDGAAWLAAYDYYGHDLTGVAYADEVMARAIGWSQRGFSINQPVDPVLRAAVHAAWGQPVRAALVTAAHQAVAQAADAAATASS
jgi:hypothetical protein